MQSAGTIVVVGFGPPALGALGGAIRAARRDDPMAAVTVVIPSSHAAVSVRRHLARVRDPAGRAGLVNVQWMALPQVAESLAAPVLVSDDRPLLTDVVRRAAIRATLDSATGRFAAVAGNASTEERLERTFGELRDLNDDEIARLDAAGARPRQLVRLFRAYRDRCSGFADQRDAFDRAVQIVEAHRVERSSNGGRPSADSASALDALGHVVMYLPSRLSRPERRLLVALAGVGRLTVLLGETGDEEADRSVELLREQLASDLSTRPLRTTAASGTRVEHGPAPRFVRTPDADEEVRSAVRRIVEALEAGIAPDDIAVVSRQVQPYALLAHEHLDVAGVPHYAPASIALSQTVTGRALLGFLALAEVGFRRAELFRWVRSAPIRGRDGQLISSRLDRLARRAGVAGGVDQWHQRLDRLTDQYEREGDGRAFDLERLHDLRAFIDDLVELAGSCEDAVGWSGLAAWAAEALDRLLGSRSRLHDWPDAERDAGDEVREVLASLGTLDAIEPTVDAVRFRRVLGQELNRPVRPVGRFGHGVFIGQLSDLVGARHELVILVGLAEGVVPSRGQDDALLPDDVRAVLDGALPDRRPDRGDEKRDFLAALAAGPRQQLSFARVETRSQREAIPSRFFLRELERRRGVRTGFDDLDTIGSVGSGASDGSGETFDFVDVPSFQAGMERAVPAASEQELVVASLLRGEAADVDLVSGLEAVTARAGGSFSVWTGHIGAEYAPRFDTDDKAASATSFEQWAACPFRYFLSHVLGVRPLDAYADADAISNLDRGSLVHSVLESFIAESLHRAPEESWTPADYDRLRAMTAEIAERYEQEGRTGRPLLWQIELESLLRRLLTILEVDADERRSTGVEPIAVEMAFGTADGERPPITFTLASGRTVSFRGVADRVDQDPATGRLVVLDYKTGSGNGYQGIDADITCGGRHLQLAIYGEAARQAYDSDLVDAYYWFVEQKQSRMRVGGPIDEPRRRRFLDVLGVIVDGIEQGHFPANPGEQTFFGFEHCGFCDFNRICPTTRGDLWEGVRLSGDLADYVAMADPDPDPDPDPVEARSDD